MFGLELLVPWLRGNIVSENKADLLQRCAQCLYPGRILRFQEGGIDFVPDRREGYRYWDLDGREILDLHLNGGTFNLGHRNPQLLEVMNNAAQHYDIGNHHFPSEPKVRLAEALIECAPGDMRYVVFTPSGSEANDVAIKCARWVTGRRKVVALDAGYHGRTGLSGAAGDDETAHYFKSDYPAEFIKVPFNDLEAMQRVLQAQDVALVMMETIPATYGFPLPEDGYLEGVMALCEQYGSQFLADEVQTGLGRTGQPWAIQHWGLSPDFLVTGKGLSGGLYPMAAVIMTEACGAWLTDNGWGHVSTFGGSDLGCVIAEKALEMSISEQTLSNVRDQASYLRKGLDALLQRFPYFTAVRQCGLVMGLEFDSSTTCWLMIRALYDQGVWAMVAAFDERVMQFKPGLLIDRQFSDQVLERLENALIWFANNAGALMMESLPADPDVERKYLDIAGEAAARWFAGDTEISLIKHRENAVFKVTTASGSCYALRVHRPGYHSEQALMSEQAWVTALDESGIHTPRVQPSLTGETLLTLQGHCCTVLEWSPGELFDQLGRVEQGVLPELCERYQALGEMAARLHNQGQGWQRPQGFERHRWDIDGLLGENPLWGRFWEHPLVRPEQRKLFLKARLVLKGLLQQVGQDAQSFGLIHADFLPENILVHEGQLTLIDFDDCGFGWYMFEMATSLFPKINEPYFDDLVAAYVGGYRRHRAFSEEHLEIFPAFILLRGLTYIGWLMERAENLKHKDRLAREIIDGLCDAIPELLDELTPLQRVGVNCMAWWQTRGETAHV